MASPGSSIRSAARATFSAYRSLPVRWRLAGGSAVLTLVILCAFAVVMGVFTSRQIRSDFDRDTANAADTLAKGALVRANPARGTYSYAGGPDLEDFAAAQNADVRVLDLSGNFITGTKRSQDFPLNLPRSVDVSGYRVESREIRVLPGLGSAILQYARPLSDLQHTLARVRLLLGAGVLAGALFALLAGLTVARRAMAPIAQLTAAAREIQRTRDPSLRVPEPEADDEVAELARTLDGMLHSLDDAQVETEHALGRQREFVADASHELRTPLTSLLANLELLHDELEGEPRETVAAALRSSRRMKRLVADLLMLARADTGQHTARRPVDLAEVLVEAAADVEPLAAADGHLLSIGSGGAPATVEGFRDELVRAALNLLENAVSHTPAGTPIEATAGREGADAVLRVQDAGPGVPEALEARIFERFVRGAGDGGGGTGLGLAIVQAVAEGHGGTVALERPAEGGARFVVRIPAIPAAAPAPAPDAAPTAMG